MLAAVRALPARQREALVLRYYGDLSEAEIAETMGVSPGAVKSHTSRAPGRPAAGDGVAVDERPTDELLRRALEARASRVEVAPDALGTIRTPHRRAPSAPPGLTIGLASLAATRAAAVVAFGRAHAAPQAVTPPTEPAGVHPQRDRDRRTPTSAPALSGAGAGLLRGRRS